MPETPIDPRHPFWVPIRVEVGAANIGLRTSKRELRHPPPTAARQHGPTVPVHGYGLTGHGQALSRTPKRDLLGPRGSPTKAALRVADHDKVVVFGEPVEQESLPSPRASTHSTDLKCCHLTNPRKDNT